MMIPTGLTRKIIALSFIGALFGLMLYFSENGKDDLVRDLVIAFIASFSLTMQYFFNKDR